MSVKEVETIFDIIIEEAKKEDKTEYKRLEGILIKMFKEGNKGIEALDILNTAKAVAEYVDVSDLEDAIIESKDYDGMVFFAEHVKGTNIDKLRAEVQKSGSKRLINAFKEFVDGVNIED